jgi:hypothetical protein
MRKPGHRLWTLAFASNSTGIQQELIQILPRLGQVRWIILYPMDLDDLMATEWDAAGTVMASSATDAVRIASAWPSLKGSEGIRAVEWTNAEAGVREDAKAEDRVRAELENGPIRSSAALVMLGVTTALASDFPLLCGALESQLRRALTDRDGTLVLMAYASCLYDAARRTSHDQLSPAAASAFTRCLQIDFPRLLSAGNDQSMPPDEWIAASQSFCDLLQEIDVGTTEYSREVGSLVAAVIGAPGDPEIVGQVSVIVQSTFAKLRLREVIATAEF